MVGNKLVRHVGFDAKSAFPVVIDPSWWSTTKKIIKCSAAVAGFLLTFTTAGSAKRVITAVKLIKKIDVKKAARLIQTYAKRRKLTSAHRKTVAALLGARRQKGLQVLIDRTPQ
ncbi:hypothetical protein [Streptomyces sp. NPDC047803]|uniref:hypothetical protein n=1 Tax=unclassified Streptomyces TaxID=2593676 RepID=UPI0033EE66EA